MGSFIIKIFSPHLHMEGSTNRKNRREKSNSEARPNTQYPHTQKAPKQQHKTKKSPTIN